VLWTAASISRAADWYVATNGTGNGSFTNPWALQVAMTNTAIQGGDTVWLRNGTYEPPMPDSTNQPWSRYMQYYPGWRINGVSGTNFITYRSYTNEWAAIDDPILLGSPVRFRDLEFFNSMKGVRYNTNDLSQNGDFNAVYGQFIASATNEWINCVIHDIDGTGCSTISKMRGCILWYVAWNYREHVFYPMIGDFSGNICAWPLNRTLNNSVADYICNSNIIFGSGIQWVTNVSAGKTNGNGNSAESDVDLAPSGNNGTIIGNVDIGSVAPLSGSGNAGSVISNNIFCCATEPVSWSSPSNSVFSFNTIYSTEQHGQVLVVNTSASNLEDYNSYYVPATNSSIIWKNASQGYAAFFSLGAWQTNSGYDSHSTVAFSLPPDTVRVMVNADQAKRCNIAICNWSLKDNVAVNLSGVLNSGDAYQLYSAQNYLAGPIQTGTYNGTNIIVPMTNLTTAPILYGTNVNRWGEEVAQPPPMSPEFGAFVVIGSTQVPLPPNKFRVLSSP
jgi:hypothetical protein